MPSFVSACTTGLGVCAIALITLSLGSSLEPAVYAATLPAARLSPAPEAAAQPDPASPQFYTAQVKPIFDAACGKCHLNGNHRGAFNMDTREGLMKGGHDGAVVVPGDPGNSLLIKLIRHEGPADDPMPMPPHAAKLPDGQIAIITRWVKAGALMP